MPTQTANKPLICIMNAAFCENHTSGLLAMGYVEHSRWKRDSRVRAHIGNNFRRRSGMQHVILQRYGWVDEEGDSQACGINNGMFTPVLRRGNVSEGLVGLTSGGGGVARVNPWRTKKLEELAPKPRAWAEL